MNGDINSFIIHYKLTGSADNWTTRTVPKGVYSFNITGFEAGEKHDTNVIAVLADGTSKTTKTLTVPTLSGMPCLYSFYNESCMPYGIIFDLIFFRYGFVSYEYPLKILSGFFGFS